MKIVTPFFDRSNSLITPKINKCIVIVRSNVKALSSMSQESCDLIYGVLSSQYVCVAVVVINEYSDLEKIQDLRPDLVFLGMECVPTVATGDSAESDVYVSDFLDGLGIAYTGSRRSALILGRHKAEAKLRMMEQRVATPKFWLIKKGSAVVSTDIPLNYPIFIKPAHGGGGYGVDSRSLVRNFDELEKKVMYISSVLRTDSLLETYLPGREFSVAILQDLNSNEIKALPIELIAPPDENGTRILSNKVKSSNAEEVRAVDDLILKDKISEFSLRVFEALGARDYGRIDIRLDSNGNPHFLEVNLIPSLISGYGSFPKACALNLNLQYKDMILTLVALGLKRTGKVVVNDIYEENMPAYLPSSPLPLPL